MAEVSGVQHQRRRTSTPQLSVFTGSSGELAQDTTLQRSVVCDGVQAGGWPAGKANATYVHDTSPLGLVTDAVMIWVSKTTGRNYHLPSATQYASGQRLVVADGMGTAGSSSNIGIQTFNSGEKIFSLGVAPSTQLLLSLDGRAYTLLALSTVPGWVAYF